MEVAGEGRNPGLCGRLISGTLGWMEWSCKDMWHLWLGQRSPELSVKTCCLRARRPSGCMNSSLVCDLEIREGSGLATVWMVLNRGRIPGSERERGKC